MTSEVPLVEIRNATIWRGTTRVFKDLDLVIEQHERVAIVGPNGCGKTTLLKAINRELYPVAQIGSVFRILGRDRWNVWELRRHIGVVSQDLQQRYTPTTTALEVVVSGFHSSIGVHGVLADRVTDEQVAAARAALHDLGVGELALTPLRAMSTGQQRRCLLARALVHKPDTLILDERRSRFRSKLRLSRARAAPVHCRTQHRHCDAPPQRDSARGRSRHPVA